MKMIAVSACSMRTRAAFCLILLTLGGCGALPLPDKPVRAAPYDLGPPLPLAAHAGADRAALGLGSVDAPAALDGTHIIYRLAYSEGGQQPRPYALARWSMSPPQLVTQRLREAFAATRPVVDSGSGLARLELRAELDEFAQVFTAPAASEGVVRLRVSAVAPAAAGERLLGQRSFSVRHAAPTPDAAGGAAALRAATDEAVQQIVAWVNALPGPR